MNRKVVLAAALLSCGLLPGAHHLAPAFGAVSEDSALPNEASRPSSLAVGKQLVVAADGTGDYRAVQQAIDALPAEGGQIRVRPGVYREVLTVYKPSVQLEGADDARQVTIVFDKSASTAGSTLRSATVNILADDFHAGGITIANDFSARRPLAPQGHQALALLVTGDRAVFRNVRFLGAQDTLYAGSKSCSSEQGPCVPARQYFSECYVEGNVDFIFGNARAFFHNCEIRALTHEVVFLTAQSKHYAEEESGFVFDHCRVTAEPEAAHIYLGRPWRPYSTVVWINADLDAAIEPAGWREWRPGETNSLTTAFFAEFQSRGPGAAAAQRDPHSKQLSAAEASRFSVSEFLAGTDRWDPLRVEKGTL
jgi:pectin methylesterase-like acyl-CoA thioesterase